jgi:hypothetical protein
MLGAEVRRPPAGGQSMVRETWYRHLAIADRLIVEARECIDNHKQHLSALEHDGQDASTATALLGLLEQTLHLMHCHRATILEKVAAYKNLGLSHSLERAEGWDAREDDIHAWSNQRLPLYSSSGQRG